MALGGVGTPPSAACNAYPDPPVCIWKYGQTCPLRLAGRSRWAWRGVCDGVDLAITEIHALHLFEVEGTGT